MNVMQDGSGSPREDKIFQLEDKDVPVIGSILHPGKKKKLLRMINTTKDITEVVAEIVNAALGHSQSLGMKTKSASTSRSV